MTDAMEVSGTRSGELTDDTERVHRFVGDEDAGGGSGEQPRRTFELEETGFREVPRRWRRFYRHWKGDGDELGPNEVICPVCKVVIRSTREYRAGDRVYCMPCMSRMVIVEGPDATLVPEVTYSTRAPKYPTRQGALPRMRFKAIGETTA